MSELGPGVGGLLAVANLLAPLHQSCSPLQTHRDVSGHEDAEHCPARAAQDAAMSVLERHSGSADTIRIIVKLLQSLHSHRRESVAIYIFN